jgi:CO/xanthine dehydrogenase Mo-binding subunit
MKFGIGQPMRRHEDLHLITGRGRYTDDVIIPQMTHAFVLRSPVAHAHIKPIDTAAARRVPGVLFVATGEALGQTVSAMCPAWCHWSIVTARRGTTRLVPCGSSLSLMDQRQCLGRAAARLLPPEWLRAACNNPRGLCSPRASSPRTGTSNPAANWLTRAASAP